MNRLLQQILLDWLKEDINKTFYTQRRMKIRFHSSEKLFPR